MLEDEIPFDEANVYLEPPAVGEETDEDSSEEDQEGGLPANLRFFKRQQPLLTKTGSNPPVKSLPPLLDHLHQDKVKKERVPLPLQVSQSLPSSLEGKAATQHQAWELL